MTKQPIPSSSPATDLLDLTLAEMEAFFRDLGEPAYRARQVYRWLYKEQETDLQKMTNLSKKLRQRLAEQATITALEIDEFQQSNDGTFKVLFRLQDGARIESVLIPEGNRNTLCISSQVGCALDCRFCYTAKMGPGRNLRVSEYIGQWMGVARRLPPGQRVTNIVFMGMGEPLVNFKNLLKALERFTDEQGIGLGKRRITVSTAGLCPQIIKLGEQMPVRLAISLHATTDPQRDQIMPINKRYNLKSLFAALRQFQHKRRLPITLEYTLIEGVNDSDQDAKRLAKLAHSIDAKVNLIPYNEHPGAPEYKRPPDARITNFRELLLKAHVRATQRATRGDDISAACGQLAILAHDPEEAHPAIAITQHTQALLQRVQQDLTSS